ncbi:hypothetical protein DOY81_007971 [Sarcophaga bullata]|nr:hypothetical protein DOY81_007971 [Sarcophaga bullata]
MSYPPRPPMPPYMNPSIPPPHMMGPMVNPPPHTRYNRNSATISSQPTVYQRPPDPVPQFKGPIITVFVGNISERVPEILITRILATCGPVVNWKRVSTFGFCEYDGPTAGMRAVRLLSEIELDCKTLVAKVDAKNKLLLDNFKEEERKNGTNNDMPDEKSDDEEALRSMRRIIEEHKHEMEDFDPNVRSDLYGSRGVKTKPTRSDEIKVPKVLHETNLEEEKRNLISSEIGKFRKRAEADEHRKEKEKEPGVFSNDDDNDDVSNPKKRKLVPLDYEDNQIKQSIHVTSSHTNDRHDTSDGVADNNGSVVVGKGGNATTNKKHGKSDSSAAITGNIDAANSKKDDSSGTKVHEEKRRHIKSIIDRIPTQKEDLFNYKLDRNEIDNNLMERKIRPWINKKIIEYIGEPEPTLVDFICSKVLAGSSPQSILDDVQMVLDEEAEVFVVKMWRLLILRSGCQKDWFR